MRGTQALSDFRPRARRALRILRPAFVAMRARNPWRRVLSMHDYLLWHAPKSFKNIKATSNAEINQCAASSRDVS